MSDWTDFIEVARSIRQAVLPVFGTRAGKQLAGVAESGDATFRLDEIAEHALREALLARELRVAYYSEDRGVVNLHPSPDYFLLVDPIDGTRPAACGFEMAVVSIAVARPVPKPRFKDILAGVIVEIKTGNTFFADVTGKLWLPEGQVLNLSKSADLTRFFWSFDVVGRPVTSLFEILADLIEGSSVNGGAFLWNSAAYSLTRLLLGQLDAYLDVGGKIRTEVEAAEVLFRKAGHGRIIGLFPYDVAAAQFIASQAGAVISDAAGRSLADIPLIPEKEGDVLSLVAAANRELHEKLIFYLQRHPA